MSEKPLCKLCKVEINVGDAGGHGSLLCGHAFHRTCVDLDNTDCFFQCPICGSLMWADDVDMDPEMPLVGDATGPLNAGTGQGSVVAAMKPTPPWRLPQAEVPPPMSWSARCPESMQLGISCEETRQFYEARLKMWYCGREWVRGRDGRLYTQVWKYRTRAPVGWQWQWEDFDTWRARVGA